MTYLPLTTQTRPARPLRAQSTIGRSEGVEEESGADHLRTGTQVGSAVRNGSLSPSSRASLLADLGGAINSRLV